MDLVDLINEKEYIVPDRKVIFEIKKRYWLIALYSFLQWMVFTLFYIYYYQHHTRLFGSFMNLSINHSEDCDSTGALIGNIMGLLLGIDSIPERWISNLKYVEFIKQVAADLYTEIDKDHLGEWAAKYPAY
jgi:hypothetical protein